MTTPRDDHAITGRRPYRDTYDGTEAGLLDAIARRFPGRGIVLLPWALDVDNPGAESNRQLTQWLTGQPVTASKPKHRPCIVPHCKVLSRRLDVFDMCPRELWDEHHDAYAADIADTMPDWLHG